MALKCSKKSSSKAVVLNLLNAAIFNTVPHVVVTPNYKIILWLLHNCNVVTVINHNVNIWYAGYLICDLKGVTTHRLRTTGLGHGGSRGSALQRVPAPNSHLSRLNMKATVPNQTSFPTIAGLGI